MTELFKLEVKAGRHDREHCPVSYRIPADAALLKEQEVSSLSLKDDKGNESALQCELQENGDLLLYFIVSGLAEGASRIYTVSAGDEQPVSAAGVKLVEKENKLDIEIDGSYFTSFVFDPEVAKPYVGPVIGPGGDSFTRLDFETKEHPHHRSLWLAIGDVNGIDFWNEPKDKYGKQMVAGFAERTDGPVLARIVSSQNWCSFGGKTQLTEKRTVTFYNTPADRRFIDLDFELKAGGRVELGATKEAGPLGIRVAESMKAENGGTIVNSFGSVGEKECWGERAQWCDYYGDVNGQTLGIAAFDHPDNDDYPTYWHVRDYGLLAANNLYFLGGKLLQKGDTIRYRHRIYFHAGDTVQGKVAGHYQDYIHPPEVKLAE